MALALGTQAWESVLFSQTISNIKKSGEIFSYESLVMTPSESEIKFKVKSKTESNQNQAC